MHYVKLVIVMVIQGYFHLKSDLINFPRKMHPLNCYINGFCKLLHKACYNNVDAHKLLCKASRAKQTLRSVNILFFIYEIAMNIDDKYLARSAHTVPGTGSPVCWPVASGQL